MRLLGNFDDRTIENTGSSYCRVATGASLQIPESFTIESWMKIQDTGEKYFLTFNSASPATGWLIGRRNNQLTFAYRRTHATLGTVGYYSTGSTQNLDEWYHFAATYDWSNKKIKIFLMGIKVFEGGIPADAPMNLNSTIGLCVGGYLLSGTNPTNTTKSMFSDTRYWNKVRTEREIALDYKTHIDQAEGLVLSVRGVNMTTTQAIDMSGYNNHGTLVGSPIQSKDSPFNKVLTTGEGVNTKLLLSQPKTPYALELTGAQYGRTSVPPEYIGGTDGYTIDFIFKRVAGEILTIWSNRIISPNSGLEINVTPNGDITWTHYGQIGRTHIVGFPAGVYCRCTMTFTNALSKGAIYKDGIDMNVVSWHMSSYLPADSPVTIGGAYNATTAGTKGVIQRVARIGRVLTSEEVAKINHKDRDDWELHFKATPNGLREITKGIPVTHTGEVKLIESTAPVGQRSNYYLYGDTLKLNLPTADYGSATFEGWFYITVSNRTIFGNVDHVNGNGFRVTVSTTSTLRISVPTLGSSEVSSSLTGAPSVNYNEWVHIAAVLTPTYARLLVNGKFGIQLNTTAYTPSTMPLQVNGYTNSTGGLTNAMLGLKAQGVRAWTGARTDEEIKQNMHVFVKPDAANLVEQYKIVEGIGNTTYGDKGSVSSLVVSGNTGWQTPTIANWVNQCVTFNGSQRFALAKNDPSFLDNLKQITVEVTVYHSAFNATGDPIIDDTTHARREGQFFTRMDAAGYAYFYIFNAAWKFVRSSNTYPMNNWYTLTMTYDGTNIRGYVNGVLAGTTLANHSSGLGSPVGTPLNIGAHFSSGGYNRFMIGKLDELKIWKRAKPTEEVGATWNRVATRESDLIMNVRFDGNDWDDSGYGNHLVPVGYGAINPYALSDNPNLNTLAPINF